MELICPLCGCMITRHQGSYLCPTGHCFDIARQGYVHLLPVQQKHSLHPGDTKEQVASRRAFLSGGYYGPISDALCNAARRHGAKGPILDVGCGEGYYSSRLAETMDAELVGLDISKEAVRKAAGTYKNGLWLCATAAALPVADGTVGTLTSLFALTLPEEFYRVLRPGGFYFQVLAAQDHLLTLKSIVYPELKRKEKDSVPELQGFERVETLPIRFSFTVEGAQVMNLLAMTPHIYRIGKIGLERLRNTKTLTDTASCVLNVYRRV